MERGLFYKMTMITNNINQDRRRGEGGCAGQWAARNVLVQLYTSEVGAQKIELGYLMIMHNITPV